MNDLPKGMIPDQLPLVLASSSPRRSQLLEAAGYTFKIDPASEAAECGVCSRETAPELVARYAFRKAEDVAGRHPKAMILAADTVASIGGAILGKPVDEGHAEEMLRRLSGKRHDVYTGVCLWSTAASKCVVDVTRTELQMGVLTDEEIEAYLDSLLWVGKAGGFGYQDGNDWIRIIGDGSESNVVGLPMERLKELLEGFENDAETINTSPPGASNESSSDEIH
ncbi:MAG: nucleoside triphosphate pyrophosphatase [Planctomycetota bacterium]